MRYFIELSYNGKNNHGWQIQPDVISIQEKLNLAVSTILQEKIEVVGAGRTDTGVHASQMFAHFDSDIEIKGEVVHKLNSILPNDITVYKVFLVADDYHARFHAESRSYEYRIWLGRNPFLLDFSWQIHSQKLDLAKMNKAAQLFGRRWLITDKRSSKIMGQDKMTQKSLFRHTQQIVLVNVGIKDEVMIKGNEYWIKAINKGGHLVLRGLKNGDKTVISYDMIQDYFKLLKKYKKPEQSEE